MTRRWIVAAAMLTVAACGQSAGEAETSADTLTRREKDSIVSTMPIPGARGVGRALEASDRATERNNILDSLSRE